MSTDQEDVMFTDGKDATVRMVAVKPIDRYAKARGMFEFRSRPKGCTNKFKPEECPNTRARARRVRQLEGLKTT